MDPARTARRNLGLAAVLLALVAGLLAGCGSDAGRDQAAATVDGTEISQQQVQDLVEQEIALQTAIADAAKAAAKKSPKDDAAASKAAQAKQQLDAVLPDFEGSGNADTYGTEGAAQVITSLVDLEISRQVARELGVKVEQSSLDEVMKQYEQQATQEGLKTIKPYEAFLKVQAEQVALRELIKPELKDAQAAREKQLKAVYDAQIGNEELYCINVLLTGDQASNQAAVDRINGGEDFLAVANEVSTDKSTLAAGSETCVSKSQLAGVFGDAVGTAGEGAVLGPADGGVGQDGRPQWLTVRVVSKRTPTFEESRSQIEQALQQQGVADPIDEALSKAVERTTRKADIWVNPRFGRWNERTLRVDPPVDPAAKATTTTAPLLAPEPAGN